MQTVKPDLRPELEPAPARIAKLPVARGYPVPWFVAWVGADGKPVDADGRAVEAGTPGAVPEFRAADGRKWPLAVRDRLCWVCGEPLGRWLTFVIGPMCGINRTTAEPPCHHDCAQWSVRNCPFLSRPHAHRRENDMPDGTTDAAGFMIDRNPGVSLLWITRDYRVFGDGKGGRLIQIGDAARVEWWGEGKPATRAAVAHSIDTGLPILMKLAEESGPADVAELVRRAKAFEAMYPKV